MPLLHPLISLWLLGKDGSATRCATDKIIENCDFVTLDYGAYYNGYVSDITRTLAVGEPDAELKKSMILF